MNFDLYSQRILSLRGDVDVMSTGKVIEQILSINEEDCFNDITDPKPIHLHIQSCGGDVLDSFALSDVILDSATPIYTYCDGYVESAAINIFVSGIRRYAYPHSRFLLHNLRMDLENKTPQNMEEYVQYFSNLQEQEINFLIARTLMKKDEMLDVLNRNVEYLFDVNRAKELGIVTDILEYKNA